MQLCFLSNLNENVNFYCCFDRIMCVAVQFVSQACVASSIQICLECIELSNTDNLEFVLILNHFFFKYLNAH